MGGVTLSHVAPKGILSAVVVRQMHGMLELIPRTDKLEAGLLPFEELLWLVLPPMLTFEERLLSSSGASAVELRDIIGNVRQMFLPPLC